jgi:two-component system, cell cycle sensor histidine kinase and response regulator CckA
LILGERPETGTRAPAKERLDGVETILLVEDEARVRKLIVDVLSARGYEVLEATRGEEAIRLCRTCGKEIQLSVVDVVMPEMSGPDLVRQLSALKPAMRVLFISGYTDEAIIHHGILRSGAAFLEKPFLPDVLARKVREVLDQQHRSVPGPSGVS